MWFALLLGVKTLGDACDWKGCLGAARRDELLCQEIRGLECWDELCDARWRVVLSASYARRHLGASAATEVTEAGCRAQRRALKFCYFVTWEFWGFLGLQTP